jgi:hypothetical protein
MLEGRDNEQMFWELNHAIRSLQEEIMRLRSELRDHLEMQRHPMYEQRVNTMEYAGMPWSERENLERILRDGVNMSPVQAIPEETVTGWDPAQNA